VNQPAQQFSPKEHRGYKDRKADESNRGFQQAVFGLWLSRYKAGDQ
jgi:hypothetical protein